MVFLLSFWVVFGLLIDSLVKWDLRDGKREPAQKPLIKVFDAHAGRSELRRSPVVEQLVHDDHQKARNQNLKEQVLHQDGTLAPFPADFCSGCVVFHNAFLLAHTVPKPYKLFFRP